ncbi:uncharacterized protein RSE6_13065 [Rhynchosporium secalis]|uniref:Insecticidal crystal toxin domain-containing protein n=1 Tax=Rhynchosporium secalis TaxID=38038 RepID=A0A1E1MRZ3_RHYSE|nr:uncharacterized protein RSE6_13065 [Rhynchosporium secalis]
MAANKTFDYGDLRVTLTNDYSWTYDTTGASMEIFNFMNLSTWQPQRQGEMKALGTFAEGKSGQSYHDINKKRASVLVGPNPNTRPSRPAVASPTDYTLLWTDKGSQGEHDGSIWRPIAPAGYVSLGDVCVYKYNKPSVDLVWCVRDDFAGTTQFQASPQWTDRRGNKLGLWPVKVFNAYTGIEGTPNIPVNADTFRAATGLGRPDPDLARILQLPLPRQYQKIDSSWPEISKNTMPSKGQLYSEKVQASVTLPFTCFFPPTDEDSLLKIRDPFCAITRSTAYFAEGVWVNDAEGSLKRSAKVTCGITKEKREEFTHTVGVEISASGGIGLFESSVSLNYQFTYSNSSTFTEFTQTEITQEFDVGPFYAKVLFSKHVWIKGTRSSGSIVINATEITASDDYIIKGCSLK